MKTIIDTGTGAFLFDDRDDAATVLIILSKAKPVMRIGMPSDHAYIDLPAPAKIHAINYTTTPLVSEAEAAEIERAHSDHEHQQLTEETA